VTGKAASIPRDSRFGVGLGITYGDMADSSKDAPKAHEKVEVKTESKTEGKAEAKPEAQSEGKAGEVTLTPAEKKKRAKEEKQARRAAQKGDTPAAAPPAANGTPDAKPQRAEAASSSQPKQQGQKPKAQQQKQAEQAPTHHKRAGSVSQSMPLRRRPSLSGDSMPRAPKPENKQVELFSHLYSQPRRQTLAGVGKDVHPAVLALGLQMSSYEICGSSARCVAMLLAFKEAISSYTTPTGTSLARHMTAHFLSPQIDFLKSCRPISESMGNAIRFLKKLIVEIDPAVEEVQAKACLCENIDVFIRDRITATDSAIASSAALQIKPNAVVLTYAKSSLVEKTLLQAHAQGTPFRVIVADSRPLFEGKNLARTLMRAGLEVEYTPLSGIAHAVKTATVVLLGAHSMLSNGRLQSRIGTASVAMHASCADIPVIVLCESVKFTGKVALDSIVLNEIAPEEELLIPFSPLPDAGADAEESREKTLADWREIKGLQILNLMYDVTPAEYIRMVICEYGSLPPSSVPVVHRLANEGI
jgi:translation initiation factor eIF-2B subunit delta